MQVRPLLPAAELRDASGFQSALLGRAVWRVTVEVSNEADVDGTEVVQLYVQDPAGLPFVPFWRRLLAFGRVHVAAKAKANLTLDVAWEHLAQFDGDMRLRVMPGEYELYAGGNAEETPLSAAVTV